MIFEKNIPVNLLNNLMRVIYKAKYNTFDNNLDGTLNFGTE